MKNTFMLITSMSANLSGGILKKHINDKYENNMFSYQFYNMIVSFVAALILLMMSNKLNLSVFTVVLAFLFGLTTLFQQIFNLYALENGPLSYTTVIVSMSTLIPTVSGAIFWNERIAFIQYIGIIFMILCFILSIKNENSDKKANIKWFVCSLITFIMTGLIGVMQKIHQTSSHKSELDGFLVVAFIVSFIFSLLLSLIFRKSRFSESAIGYRPITGFLPVVFMILSGVFVALNNKFNLYLSGVIDAAVFFPLVNGGGLVLTSVASVLIFKEKLSAVQLVGVISGIISVILVCNPYS